MTKQEFEQRLGKEVSFETFKKYNTLYMESELDKDEFVALYKHIPEAAVDDLARAFSIKNDSLNAYLEREKLTKKRDEQIACELLEEDDHLAKFATRLTSQEYVIRYKLEHDYDLTSDNRQWLLSQIDK